MALANIIAVGTYSNISSLTINRSQKMVSFDLDVWENDKAENLLFTKNFVLTCISNRLEADSITKETPDEKPVEGDYYYIPKTAKGEWEGKTLHFAQILSGQTCFIKAQEGQVFYCKADRKYYKIKADGALVPEIRGDASIWKKYFDFSVSTADNTNLVKQCYQFIKDSGIYPTAINV